ncbi:hypothetical protein [Polyangium mundeleinium]|uniref:PEGA domain-containing protein n=1 Tax=Polyangium mundeleinium TaxID=2995306 RepID=A0ABT5F338_9BACT|nr:hypothetical protein [Polyangium mundeleinium]MDC0747552.1 hypothetical protein [Polyangium mundeleinium]
MKYLHLASTVLFAISVSSSALAEEPSLEPPKPEPLEIPYTSYTTGRAHELFYPPALRLLREAQALEKEGKAQAALDKYRDAYDRQRLSDVQLELAFAQARMGLYLPAARNLAEVMAIGYVKGRTVHTDEEVHAVRKAVKARIGTIVPRVNIPGVRLTVDGEEVTDWPFSEEFYVEPGTHTIKSIADGYYFNETTVELKAGEQKVLNIAMQQRIQSHYVAFPAAPMNVSIHANISRATNDPPTWPRNLMIASAVSMGLGIGGLATGLVFVNNAESKSDAATWTGVAAAGGMLLGLGVIGMGIGVASRPEPPPPNVIITPQFAKGAGGVQVTGTIP